MTVQKVIVYEFVVSDADDPDLYASEPLYKWEKSEAGQWIMQHAKDVPSWRRHMDYNRWGYTYQVVAKLAAEDYTYYCLKWK